MKVLVTGGAGFIGSNVVNLLVKKGYKVVVVDNLFAGSKAKVNKKAKFYKADTTKIKELSCVFAKERPDKVIHAAAQIQVTYSMENPQFDALTNVIGGINVLECCRRFKVKKIVYLCTGGALYGNPEYMPADEGHPIRPICCYGASKRAFEYYLHVYLMNYGLDYVSVRFSNVYGPGDDLNCRRVIPNWLIAFSKHEAPFITGDGKQSRDFIYVGDVARAVVLALEKHPKKRNINIGSETMITMNELFSTMKKLLRSNLKPTYIGKRKGEVLQMCLSNGLAYKELGWKPEVKLTDGLRKTIEWFRENTDLKL